MCGKGEDFSVWGRKITNFLFVVVCLVEKPRKAKEPPKESCVWRRSELVAPLGIVGRTTPFMQVTEMFGFRTRKMAKQLKIFQSHVIATYMMATQSISDQSFRGYFRSISDHFLREKKDI